MLKYLFAVLAIVIGALVWMYFGIGRAKVYQGWAPEKNSVHFYERPNAPISKIEIRAFYFVPRNKTERIVDGWRAPLNSALQKLTVFHSQQLQGRSEVWYKIYPEPIVGLKDSIDYDTDNTQYGNPQALLAISEELEQRVLNPSGNLYNYGFSQAEPESRLVMMILYEGVGASGTEKAAIVSREFLTDPEYVNTGVSVFVHEFYHTIGLVDGYTIPEAIPTTEDIMGLGKTRPIDRTYVQKSSLKKLGL